MTTSKLLTTAAVSVAAALGAAAPAQAADAQQDICVTTTHHIGEVCTSMAVPLAKAVAACAAGDPLNATTCVSLGTLGPFAAAARTD